MAVLAVAVAAIIKTKVAVILAVAVVEAVADSRPLLIVAVLAVAVVPVLVVLTAGRMVLLG